MTGSEEVQSRLDRLESLVERQQATIENQRERIAALESARGRDGASDDKAATGSPPGAAEEHPGSPDPEDPTADADADELAVEGPQTSRRSVLSAGAILALLGLGSGYAAGRSSTAAAQPSSAEGEVGTASRPIETLYTAALDGPLTGGQTVTTLLGQGLSIDAGALSASGASRWTEADGDDLLEPTGSPTGVDVTDVQADRLGGPITGGSDVVDLLGPGLTTASNALAADPGNALGIDGSGRLAVTTDSVTVAGNSVSLGGSTGVDYTDLASTGSSFPIPNTDLANPALTVAGNAVSLGASTAIAHADLSGLGADDHHARDHDHTEAGISPIPNPALANSSVTVAGNSVSLGGSTGIAHSDLSGVGASDHHARPSAGDGLDENANAFDVEPADFAGNALEDDGSDNLAVASGSIGSNELTNAQFRDPGVTTDLSSQTSIGSWVQPSSSRPSLVQVWLYLQANDSTGAAMSILVDETGDQNQDYVVKGANLSTDVVNSGTTPVSQEGRTFYVPAGGHFQIRNIGDPENANQINDVRAVIM